MVIIGHRRHQR